MEVKLPTGGRSKALGGQGIFVDPDTGEGLEVWVDTDLRQRQELLTALKDDGARLVSFHAAPSVSLLILSPKSVRVFDQYCHPIWLSPHSRRVYEHRVVAGKLDEAWKRKVMLKSWWVKECLAAGMFLGQVEDWGGCRAGGPITDLTSIPSPTPPPYLPMETQGVKQSLQPGQSPSIDQGILTPPLSVKDSALSPNDTFTLLDDHGNHSNITELYQSSPKISPQRHLQLSQDRQPANQATTSIRQHGDTGPKEENDVQIGETEGTATNDRDSSKVKLDVAKKQLGEPAVYAVVSKESGPDLPTQIGEQGASVADVLGDSGDKTSMRPELLPAQTSDPKSSPRPERNLSPTATEAAEALDHIPPGRPSQGDVHVGDSEVIGPPREDAAEVEVDMLDETPQPDIFPELVKDVDRPAELENSPIQTAGTVDETTSLDPHTNASMPPLATVPVSGESGILQNVQNVDIPLERFNNESPERKEQPPPDPVDMTTLFEGLRFWVDLARPYRSDLVKQIVASGGKIVANYAEATHVLVHDQHAPRWGSIIDFHKDQDIWWLDAGWVSKCISAQRRVDESESVVSIGRRNIKGKSKESERKLHDSHNLHKGKIPAEDLVRILEEEVWFVDGGGSVAAFGRKLADKYGSNTAIAWSTIYRDWRNKVYRFEYLSKPNTASPSSARKKRSRSSEDEDFSLGPSGNKKAKLADSSRQISSSSSPSPRNKNSLDRFCDLFQEAEKDLGEQASDLDSVINHLTKDSGVGVEQMTRLYMAWKDSRRWFINSGRKEWLESREDRPLDAPPGGAKSSPAKCPEQGTALPGGEINDTDKTTSSPARHTTYTTEQLIEIFEKHAPKLKHTPVRPLMRLLAKEYGAYPARIWKRKFNDWRAGRRAFARVEEQEKIEHTDGMDEADLDNEVEDHPSPADDQDYVDDGTSDSDFEILEVDSDGEDLGGSGSTSRRKLDDSRANLRQQDIQGNEFKSKRVSRNAYTEQEERDMAGYIVRRIPLKTSMRTADWQEFGATHPHRSVAAYVEHYRMYEKRINHLVSEIIGDILATAEGDVKPSGSQMRAISVNSDSSSIVELP
ncbi:hypothetical protein BCR39DRAFT_514237 [Naematelia encephala]|uniref:BRCT domain-containing protein n=1 Tax=Naematelia encephala TaxID=71784 RepID=A0A1Y2BIX8_9TREE|nr:hypothetical protein BCR39DRAFT_514237 [Naematelia encephala]